VRALSALGDPAKFFRNAARKGDPFCIRLPGIGEVILTGTAEGARTLFRAPPALFEPVLPNPIEPLLGPDSLILLGGARHARERKLMAAPLCGRRMRALGGVILSAAVDAIDSRRVQTEISAQELARDLTLEVIVRAVFGVSDPHRQAEFRRATTNMLDAYAPHLSLMPQLRRRWLGLGWQRFVDARAELDRLLVAQIARRRQLGDGPDILSLLLEMRYEDGAAMDDAAILDELRTLLVAGHETTATGLVWALHYVHASERVRDRLRAEVADIDLGGRLDEVVRLPYLSAVCSEALRIHPVVPILLRRLRAPMNFLGVQLAAGTNVGVSVTLLHQDPSHYPHPERFEPERFLGSAKPEAHAYVPFGGGHRRCLGAGFATYEMKIALAAIMRSGRLTPVRGRTPKAVLRNITMGPNMDLRFTRS